MKTLFILIGFVLFPVYNALAFQSSGLVFLNLPPSAKSFSFADVQSAVEIGSASMFTNPALLTQNSPHGFNANHTLWISDATLSQASGHTTLGRWKVAAGIISASVDDIEIRDQPGTSQGTFNAQFVAVGASLARSFGAFSIGGTGLFLSEDILVDNATGFTFNFGATASTLGDKLLIGAAISGLGEMEKLNRQRSDPPSNLRLGAMADIVQFSTNSGSQIPFLFSLGADFIVPLNDQILGNAESERPDPYLSTALQIRIAELIELRGGYLTDDSIRSWSAGLSLNYFGFSLDYALIPNTNGFQANHSIGLHYRF